MTREKDLKRLVRARMRKTGEAYTAARAHLLQKSPSHPAAPNATPAPATLAERAGMSDGVVKEKTGRAWKQWVAQLDRDGAAEMTHGEIATLVKKTHGVGDWWSQMVTVGYERIKGRRALGQRTDGTYGATKSRTYAVPVEALFDAWATASIRKRWLTADGARVRTATRPKSLRLGLADGAIVAVGFVAKGKGKSAVALEHPKLPDKAAAERVKKYWGDQLDALGKVLAER
jgi:hypothetical protein